jgi:hypothetical protein
MRYMNDYDLEQARRRFTGLTMPNRLALVMVVDNLREQTDMVSDGWAYWPKPRRAADKAMALIDSSTFSVREDITDAEMRAAVRPIKSFLTRHAHVYSAEQREIILRAVTD